MIFFTIGDIFGIILLIAVVVYIIYLALWDKVDSYKKQKPYHEKAPKTIPKEAPIKNEPKSLAGVIIFLAFFAVAFAICLLLWL